MSTDDPRTESPQPDPAEVAAARLTAHALEQLEGDELAAVERLLADPARHDARAAVAETRRLAAALRAAPVHGVPPRSADLRRAVVAALAAAATPAATPAAPATPPMPPMPRQRPARSLLWPLAIAGSLLAMIAVLVTGVADRPGMLGPEQDRAVARRSEPVAGDKAATESSADADATEIRSAADASAHGKIAAEAAAEKLEVAKPQPSTAVVAPAAKAELARKMPAESRRAMDNSAAPAAAAPSSRPPRQAIREREQADAMMLAEQSHRAKQSAEEIPARNNAVLFATVPGAVEGGGGERYARFAEGPVASTDQQPLSTFSIDVDTASYANVRRFLASGRMPPRDAVRIEELVNYFRYDYPQPGGDMPFSVTIEAAACPWNAGRRLVRIGLQGRAVDRRERPAGNLVFLVDVSGSMGAPNKLPLVKQALAMLVEELTENDSVAIVTYAGDAGVKLPATSGDQKATILAAIESLTSGGSTHGSAGIALAYAQAAERFIAGGVNRVILASDGDLNVGVTSDEALVALVREKAAAGTFLTVLGFGEGNLQDEKMEKIADNGNGIYAYIDGAREARKVLVEQLTGSTITIAKDVKIQVEFNPAQVASHRLLGYENRVMAAADFRNDRKDAGEIGAGHSVTAVYEIELTGDADGGTGAEPLKYRPRPVAPPRTDAAASHELLTVKLRWKQPDGDTSRLVEVPLADRGGAFEQASADMRFAAAVAAFGMILRGSEHRGEATLPMVARIAGGSLGTDAGGWRAEFLDLVRRAESLQPSAR